MESHRADSIEYIKGLISNTISEGLEYLRKGENKAAKTSFLSIWGYSYFIEDVRTMNLARETLNDLGVERREFYNLANKILPIIYHIINKSSLEHKYYPPRDLVEFLENLKTKYNE
ncbi:MAG: hypothetical protein QXJ28_02860 [Candidatus Pacearchaeota archaeon]